jgi:hypothetical protein
MGDELLDSVALARALTALLDTARSRLAASAPSPLVERITTRIVAPLAEMPNVVPTLQRWEHVNLHRGVSAHVETYSPDAV